MIIENVFLYTSGKLDMALYRCDDGNYRLELRSDDHMKPILSHTMTRKDVKEFFDEVAKLKERFK